MLFRRFAALILTVSLFLCPMAGFADDAAGQPALPETSGSSALDEASGEAEVSGETGTSGESAADGEAAGSGELDLDASEDGGRPQVSCSSYAVISEETGQVLIEKNGNQRAYPASTTKIMTMGLTLASGIGLETKLATSREAVAEIYADSTQLYLAVGEEMTVRDLLYGAQVRSANDGANVLAEGVGGSLERFAGMMNDKAQELGLTGTHFVNAHGLPDDDHYTTAIDLAQITRWALSVDGFAEIFASYTYTTAATNAAAARPMTTTCDILNPAQPGYYEYATGAKLGWTVASKYTLSTAAERDGVRLICVVMGEAADTALYADTAALLDYCFDSFRAVTVTPRLTETVIPVYDDISRTGDIAIQPRPFTIYLHRALSESDILTTVDIPESYDAAGEIAPGVRFILKNESGYQYAELGEYALDFEERPLDGYDTVRTTVLDITERKKPLGELLRELLWVVVPVGTLLIALLVSLFVQLFGKKTDKLRYRSKYE